VEVRIRLENPETFTNMAKESTIFAESFPLIDTLKGVLLQWHFLI
jgi:hypothetical protein